MIHRSIPMPRLALAAFAALAIVPSAMAQQPAPAPPAKQKQAAPAQQRPAAEAAVADPGRSGDSALRQRVEQLEEQLVDMHVVVGTLESLAKGGASSSSAAMRGPAAGGGDLVRVDALEGQLRALTAQIEQLSQQVRSLGARPVAGAPVRDEGDAAPRPPRVAAIPAPAAGPRPGGFGSTTVTPETGGDQIGRVLSGNDTAASATTASLPSGGDANPKQLYETAYGYLLQQDYVSAETAFDDFLKRFPNDGLAGNAQYWLGESFFVRGQYKNAASAFLKGYQTYARNAKAPDSLLKLAMSLDRLGQKDAACSSFGELTAKFPTAPTHVRSRADSERRRLGCA